MFTGKEVTDLAVNSVYFGLNYATHISSPLHNDKEMGDEGLDYLCSKSEVQLDFKWNAAGQCDLFFFLLFD